MRAAAKELKEGGQMILNLTVTMVDVEVARLDIHVDPDPASAPEYVLEYRDRAGEVLGKAAAGGLKMRHVLNVGEEPDD